ncbi:MAG: transglycosylase SLT domain-containing protein, partial [Terriglobales bacterium]
GMASEADIYPLIAAAAARSGLDWWLIYGVIEQESGFDPASESSCGALGLMQLMPSSFPAWARTSLLDPANNVKLGSEFLRECIAIWKAEGPDEAVKFGLASYNGGPGYVLAAQRAAAAAGEDAASWAAVAPFLAEAVVDGKRPDVEQITDYVARIWRRYAARRGSAVPVQAERAA